MFNLENKNVLITGSSRGLGYAMAEGFIKAGANVIISSRKQDACEQAAKTLNAIGPNKAFAQAAHMGDIDSIDQLIASSIKQCGSVDVLVNNAAISVAFGSLDQNDVAMFNKMNDVNLRGPWYLASRLAPKMRDAGGGNIINVISVGGLKPGAGVGIYCANKAALYALTKSMAAEWAGWNVRVNALAPGPYRTDMFNNAANTMEGFEQGSIDATLQKRVAEPKELIGSALFLASDASSYTTGSVVVSDGGYMVAT